MTLGARQRLPANLSHTRSQLTTRPVTAVEVTCPDGVGPGDLIHVELDGAAFDVAVPPDVLPGATFQVEYESDAAAAAAAPPAPPAPPTEPDTDDSLLMMAVRERRLTPENAQALRDIMEALYDFDDLDEYIDDNWHAFEAYDAEGEQRLDWQTVHLEYVALVESKIQEHLAMLGATPDGLYALLGQVAGGDERAEAFLERLLGMGDYHHFCSAMRAGGGTLKVSGLDLKKLSGGRHADFAAALAARYGT